ncbi:MAG: hypothetical protein JOY62_03505 [Acidobacteriaceae bacterium]|nr:hypothetical protein [Acidobacteriaceae bacterium]MBV9779017.1 hypothetical protein [Acidobacteriaceae bacterium]
MLKRGLAAATIPALQWERAESIALHIGGATIHVALESDRLDLSTGVVFEWVSQAARAVTKYFEKFPVQQASINIFVAEKRHGVFHGKSFGDRGAHSRITVGQHTTEDELREDWMMTHEMIHFGFPSVPERHHWIEEGSATYIEPIARGRIGALSAERVWGDLVRDMPQGLPRPSDRGLDNTDSWASTYWGGALFCLLADVEIRKRTGNTKGLEHAFRAINHAGGTIEVNWPLERALEIGSKATDGNTLLELYEKMGTRHMEVNLSGLWKQLGIISGGRAVSFDHDAPLASVRAAILS